MNIAPISAKLKKIVTYSHKPEKSNERTWQEFA